MRFGDNAFYVIYTNSTHYNGIGLPGAFSSSSRWEALLRSAASLATSQCLQIGGFAGYCAVCSNGSMLGTCGDALYDGKCNYTRHLDQQAVWVDGANIITTFLWCTRSAKQLGLHGPSYGNGHQYLCADVLDFEVHNSFSVSCRCLVCDSQLQDVRSTSWGWSHFSVPTCQRC